MVNYTSHPWIPKRWDSKMFSILSFFLFRSPTVIAGLKTVRPDNTSKIWEIEFFNLWPLIGFTCNSLFIRNRFLDTFFRQIHRLKIWFSWNHREMSQLGKITLARMQLIPNWLALCSIVWLWGFWLENKGVLERKVSALSNFSYPSCARKSW